MRCRQDDVCLAVVAVCKKEKTWTLRHYNKVVIASQI